MQPVNVSPTLVSQDTDLKGKDLSATSTESDKYTEFSSLVEQHLPEENKTSSRDKSATTDQGNTAIEDKTIAVSGKGDVDESQERQESGSKESASDSTNKKEANTNTTVKEVSRITDSEDEGVANQDALTESEQFISLLYNSDQTLSQSKQTAKQGNSKEVVDSTIKKINENDIEVDNVNVKNNQSKVVGSGTVDQDNAHLETTHKLNAFSKDELLARSQLANSNDAVSKSGDQILKDYQLSLQSQQSTINSQSITSEQLTSALLKNNKVTDLAAGISQASKNQITGQVDLGLYQLPVEPIDKKSLSSEQVLISPELSPVKEQSYQINNKSNALGKPQGELNAELATEEADTQLVKKVNSSLEDSNVNADTAKSQLSNANKSLDTTNFKEKNVDTATSQLSKANIDKLIADRNIQTLGSLENIVKEQVADNHIKQPVMTNAQIQALQQAQAQQKIQSANSEQQADDSASDEYIDSMLPAGEKTVEANVQTSSKVINNIAMRSMSDIQAQAIQATQVKQNNDAYLEHQVSEVLNHNVASDTAQIQKNNVQLQQETVSIFRKDFADAVKDKVMITINQKLQQFDIKLDPPEFGNMQVRINLQGEQASVNFVVQNQQAKDALEQNMHKLREMLSEQGVDVGGANVEQQNQEQNTGEQGLSKNNSNGTVLLNDAETEEDNVEHVLSAQLFDSSATSVDYYA